MVSLLQCQHVPRTINHMFKNPICDYTHKYWPYQTTYWGFDLKNITRQSLKMHKNVTIIREITSWIV